MLSLNHGYQKSAGMVGVAYQTAMSGLEGAAKMTSGLVLLDGLRKSGIFSYKSTLRLVATTVSKAPSCSWLLQCSTQLYRSIC